MSRKLLAVPALIAYGLVLIWLGALALPSLLDAAERLRGLARTSAGTTGLIFVESPEVYTRQRLVNDRYGQDAWLKERLRAIDANDSLFLESSEDLERYLELSAAGPGDGAAADAQTQPTDPSVEGLDVPVPFPVEFQLQSAARDKIRQLILENALDDRHDLSGNTVFGLKFDTAVLPGARTALSPAVVVRMMDDPVQALPRPISRLAGGYLNSHGPDPESSMHGLSPEDVSTIAKMDSHFDKWRLNVETRLNDIRALAQPELCRATPPTAAQAGLLDARLCASGVPDPTAMTALDETFARGAAADAALDYVMRLSKTDNTYGPAYLSKLRAEAVYDCQAAPADQPGPTLRSFLDTLAFRIQRHDLPEPWGRLFEMRTDYRVDESLICSGEIDLRLYGLEVSLIQIRERLESESLEALVAANWLPIYCNAAVCADADRLLLAQAPGRDVSLEDSIRSELPAVDLHGALEAIDDVKLACFATEKQEPWRYLGIRDTAPTAQDGVRCFPGLADTFRYGGYHFLRRMSEVESYTYAAFPRGDVSGVVSETTSGTGLSGDSGTLGGIAARFGYTQRDSSRRVAARPAIINFASGQGPSREDPDAGEVFDFGWAIVKEGHKEPMVASQLVLVSVPAYLDELRLEVWKGFLDMNAAPRDRVTFNDAKLEQRLATLMPTIERQKMTLKIPPDYNALDGILIGTNLVSGPRINEFRLPGCVEIDPRRFTLAIPGERLWRSTVVTLDGDRATGIEVMPDMRGILATFENLGQSGTGADGYDLKAFPDTSERTLTVWTSEGNDDARITLRNAPTKATGCSPASARVIAYSRPAGSDPASPEPAVQAVLSE